LTAEQVKKILEDQRVQHVIAREFGITQPHVSEIKNGKYWRGIL
jgi:predicted XRE-type DNA-binding protein